ncbi:MAG: nuclear transport factor 2 family protein [Acidimicrobiales bacterium]|nr:nuclear transport factor 2 family protein [Acidimicrobiales bacterium]
MTDADDRLALRHLVDSYAAGCDRKDVDILRSCFVDGATNTVHWLDRDATTMTAPDDLERIPTGLARYDQTFHFVGNHRVELAGDEATGDVYCFAHHLTGKNDFVMAIRYEDHYVRTSDGWRIATRDLHLLWTANETVN